MAEYNSEQLEGFARRYLDEQYVHWKLQTEGVKHFLVYSQTEMANTRMMDNLVENTIGQHYAAGLGAEAVAVDIRKLTNDPSIDDRDRGRFSIEIKIDTTHPSFEEFIKKAQSKQVDSIVRGVEANIKDLSPVQKADLFYQLMQIFAKPTGVESTAEVPRWLREREEARLSRLHS